MKNAQSSMEFLTLVGLAFLTVILFVAVSANEIKGLRDAKEFFLIEDMALKLQKEISVAASVEDGYVRTFILGERLDHNVDYYTTIMENTTLTINSSKALFGLEYSPAENNSIIL